MIAILQFRSRSPNKIIMIYLGTTVMDYDTTKLVILKAFQTLKLRINIVMNHELCQSPNQNKIKYKN